MGLAYGIAPGVTGEAARTRATLASGLLDARERCGLDELALWARVAIGGEIATVTALVDDEVHVIASSGIAPGTYSRELTFCTHAIAEPASLLCIPDARLDPRFSDNPYVTGWPWVRFYVGVVLMTAGGVPLGALCALDSRPRTGLLAREARVLTEIADEVMRRVERQS